MIMISQHDYSSVSKLRVYVGFCTTFSFDTAPMGGGNFNWNGTDPIWSCSSLKNLRVIQTYRIIFGFSSCIAHGRTLYLQALRDAVAISRIPVRSSPPRAAKKQKVAPSGGMLFRGAELKALASESPGPASPTENSSVDPALDELT